MICPENDDDAAELGSWFRWFQVYRRPPSTGFHHLRGPDAHRATIEICSRGAAGVLYFGHGREDALYGDADLLDATNIHCAARAVVIAIACLSAAQLADRAVQAGVAGYLGFTEEFLSASPHHDRFGHAVLSGIEFLLEGASLGDVADRMKLYLDRIVADFKEGDFSCSENAPITWMYAEWNRNALAVKGEVNARLQPS